MKRTGGLWRNPFSLIPPGIVVVDLSEGADMKWKGWEKVPLIVTDPADPSKGSLVEAIAPVIISASRSTDIPAFYGEWFMARLAAGYVRWKNPFGTRTLYVSFEKTRVFVFWSKNPAPFFPHLDMLDPRTLKASDTLSVVHLAHGIYIHRAELCARAAAIALGVAEIVSEKGESVEQAKYGPDRTEQPAEAP